MESAAQPTPPSTGRPSRAMKESAVARVRNGEAIVHVAASIGRERDTVRRWCKKAGVQSSHGPGSRQRRAAPRVFPSAASSGCAVVVALRGRIEQLDADREALTAALAIFERAA